MPENVHNLPPLHNLHPERRLQHRFKLDRFIRLKEARLQAVSTCLKMSRFIRPLTFSTLNVSCRMTGKTSKGPYSKTPTHHALPNI